MPISVSAETLDESLSGYKESCRIAGRLGDSFTLSDPFKAFRVGMCFGAVSAVGLNYIDKCTTQGNFGPAMALADVGKSGLAQVFVNWADANPQASNQSFYAGMLMAFNQTFGDCSHG